MARVVPLVVWLHTLPHNILTDPAKCHAWLSAPWDEASKLQRPLPDGVLKIAASGEPMDGDAGVPAQPFLLQTPVLA
jgi:putative SOS response-associated peptidase YedK